MDWNTGAVNIIYASNDGYAEHLAASLYSPLDYNRNVPRMDIYILSVGTSEAYLEQLADITGKFCCSLHVTEPGNLRERFDYTMNTRGFDINATERLFAPEVLPDNIKKVLYLDRDTIVNGSIRLLYKTELKDHLTGMVMKPTVYREMKESIGIEKDEPYYSSGALLMDLGTWRNQGVLRRLLEFYRVHQGSFFACDQDTINRALRDRIMTLPVRYDYFTNYRYFRYKTLISMCRAYRTVGEDRYRQAGKAPVIIHYLGDKRPQIAGNHNHFRRFYKYYLDKTPWKEAPKQERKRLYMHMRWMFNHTSLIYPAFRLRISRRLGVRLVDNRRKQKVFRSRKRYG